MVDRALRLPAGSKFMVLAPYVSGKKGEYRKQMAEMVKEGFLRARVDGKFVDLDDPPELDKQKKHTIEIVVDRLVAKPADDEEYRKRLADSIETATRVSGGLDRPLGGRRAAKRSSRPTTPARTAAPR